MKRTFCEIARIKGEEHIYRYRAYVGWPQTGEFCDCNKCKHKVTCLVDPKNERLYIEI